MSQTNTPTLANYGQLFDNAQPTLAHFDNQVMSGVGNQPQNSTYKVINDAICQLVSGKPKQECSPEYIKHMNEMVTQAVTGTPKQKYSPEDIAYMNKKIIQEINSYYEPPKVSEKENTEKFMNVFTRSILSQMIKDAQNSSKIANGTETGYAVDIPMENNAELFVGNEAIVPSEFTLTGEVSRRNLFSSLNNAVHEKINGMRNDFIGHVQNKVDITKNGVMDLKEKGVKVSKMLITLKKYNEEALPYYKKYESFNKTITDVVERNRKKNEFMLDTVRRFSSEGYIRPTSCSRVYDKSDFRNLNINYHLNRNRPDAQEMLRISILGTDSYSNNSQFVHIPSNHVESVQSMFYLTGDDKIPNDMKGLAFNSNSDFSKRLSASKELQNAINQDVSQKNRTEKEPYLIIDFQKDENLHLSIGHGRVIYRLTNDGYVEGCLFDKYDFAFIRPGSPADKDKMITFMNDYAYYKSVIRKFENYYYIVNFKYKLNK